jgi:phosphoglycolate phosphatase
LLLVQATVSVFGVQWDPQWIGAHGNEQQGKIDRGILVKGKAIIFDLDGTLLDTLRDMGETMNIVLREHGFLVHPMETYRLLVREGIHALLWRTLPEEKRDKVMVTRLLEKMREEYRRRWPENTRVFPGVPEMLDELEYRGLPKAILTNKVHHVTLKMVEKLIGAWSFSAVRGVLPGAPRKPDPAVALDIAREMNIPPQDIVLVGDSDIDMQAARAAGMYAVGVLWGFYDAADLLSAGAHTLMSNPHELFNFLV